MTFVFADGGMEKVDKAKNEAKEDEKWFATYASRPPSLSRPQPQTLDEYAALKAESDAMFAVYRRLQMGIQAFKGSALFFLASFYSTLFL